MPRRIPSASPESPLDGSLAQRDLDPANILPHDGELVGQDSRAVEIDLVGGGGLVVADTGAQHQGEAVDLRLGIGQRVRDGAEVRVGITTQDGLPLVSKDRLLHPRKGNRL